MIKLGISAFYHDSAAALIIDNKVIAAAEEERFTGIKHDSNFPKNAIKYVLSEADKTIYDIEEIYWYESPEKKTIESALRLLKKPSERFFLTGSIKNPKAPKIRKIFSNLWASPAKSILSIIMIVTLLTLITLVIIVIQQYSLSTALESGKQLLSPTEEVIK